MFNRFRNLPTSFIVYQMGKVGSSSIRDGLARTHGDDRVLHTHLHGEASQHIRQWRRDSRAVVVITGFREPLSRCISAYFENIDNEPHAWYFGNRQEVLATATEALVDDFNRKVEPHLDKIVRPWLEHYERAIGRKVSRFARKDGYWKTSRGNVYFYIYKLEQIDAFYRAMLSDRLLHDANHAPTNVADQKWYADIYQRFKTQYTISKARYDELYGQLDFVRHLYTPHELQHLTHTLVTP